MLKLFNAICGKKKKTRTTSLFIAPQFEISSRQKRNCEVRTANEGLFKTKHVELVLRVYIFTHVFQPSMRIRMVQFFLGFLVAISSAAAPIHSCVAARTV